MKMRFLLVLERLESILKRFHPKSFSAGPPAPLDLAFPWISISRKEMLTGDKYGLKKRQGSIKIGVTF
jgi:hypothetical protein